jgi:hypothetical protein
MRLLPASGQVRRTTRTISDLSSVPSDEARALAMRSLAELDSLHGPVCHIPRPLAEIRPAGYTGVACLGTVWIIT